MKAWARMDLARLVAMPETVRGYVYDSWAPRPGHHPRVLSVFVLLAIASHVAFLFARPARPATRAPRRNRSRSRAKNEAPDSKPSDQDVAPTLLSKKSVADSDLLEEAIPPASPFQQDVPRNSPSEYSEDDSDPSEQDISSLESDDSDTDLFNTGAQPTNPSKQTTELDDLFTQDNQPIGASQHSTADSQPLEQGILPRNVSGKAVADVDLLEEDVPDKNRIVECIHCKEKNALATSQLLDECEGILRTVQAQLMFNGKTWFGYSKRIWGQCHSLRQYDLFHDRISGPESTVLEFLQGPVKNIPESCAVSEGAKPSLSDMIKWSELLTEIMGDYLPQHPRISNVAFELNQLAITKIKEIVSESDSSVLGKIDVPMKLMKQNNGLVLEQGTRIDKVLADHAYLIAKRQEDLDEMVMMAVADQIITLFNAPSDWETLDAKNGIVVEGNREPAQRARKVLTSGPRLDVAVQADIVNNVYEISRTFRGGFKERFDPTPEPMISEPSLFSQVKDSPKTVVDKQHAEEMWPLRKAQEDMEKLLVKVGCMQRDREISRKYQEDTIKDQDSQAAAIASLQCLRRKVKHNK